MQLIVEFLCKGARPTSFAVCLIGVTSYLNKTQHPKENIFAFEYMVHMNIDERPGYPLCFNISNPQIVTSKGVEFIQPLNEEIFLIQ